MQRFFDIKSQRLEDVEVEFTAQAKKYFGSLPFLSIQVDGGSEFMAFFEQACKKAKIPLFVLPPRSPELNGHVERSNSTAKYEFYAQYQGVPSLHLLRKKLDKFSLFTTLRRPIRG